MAESKSWTVDLVATTEHRYVVIARTAEEAESLAEDLYFNGDEGSVIDSSVDMAIAASGDDDDLELEEETFEP